MDRQAGTRAGEDLLALALSRPEEALDRADTVLRGAADPCAASYARQARGIVLRDRGDTAAALPELRAALRSARSCAVPDRVADVRATLGAALAMAGRTAAGLRELDEAVDGARGRVQATALMRRAYVLAFLGRNEQALDDLRRALVGIRRAGDAVWEARTLNNRANLEVAVGSVTRAERDVRRAEELFISAGQQMEALQALHNRGWLAYLRGDLPTAFELYDRAAAAFAEIGAASPDLVLDRCAALLAGGLTGDAVVLAEETLQVDGVARQHLQPRHRAELQLMLADAALAHGQAGTACDAARIALRGFLRQGRLRWADRAELTLLRAEMASGARPGRLLPNAVAVADRLAYRGGPVGGHEAAIGLLLAGRLALAAGARGPTGPPDGHDLLARAARYRRSSSDLARATGWLAQALDREARGDRPGALRACGRGLTAVDEYRSVLGGTELRALATSHGEELAATGSGQFATAGTGRALLAWSERWRATALTLPPVRAPRDPELAGALAAMRATARRLDGAYESGLPTTALAAELSRQEAAVRGLRLRASSAGLRAPTLDLAALMDELGATTLIELVEVGEDLHALVVRRGRVRRIRVGPISEAVTAVQRSRFALRQAARGRPTELAGVAAGLEASVLGAAARVSGDGPIVLSPPGRLHHAPWALCPSLAGRPVSACPSAASWLRARRTSRPASARLVLIAGPGLPSDGAEVMALATSDPTALVLSGPEASVEATLVALDGAAVAHLAAHGRYRRDSPMFSSLLLADGPLTVHDLESVPRPPHRVVLSACDSGVMAPVGSDELLGMAGVLLAQGSAGVLCALTEVNDAATVPLMVGVHVGLARGRAPAEALLDAREAARGDLVATATAVAFAALGA